MEDFGKYMKTLRENQRLSLREVEQIAGVSNAYLSLIESGKRKNPPTPMILQKLAKVYGIPYTELLIQAGYLKPKNGNAREKARIDQAFRTVLADPKFHSGTRLRGKQISLEVKKAIIEMYERITKRKVL